MVLHLKVWESKTLPGLLASQIINKHDAGWSSPVARQAHNLKVVGSNPTPATKYKLSKEMQTPCCVGMFAMAHCSGHAMSTFSEPPPKDEIIASQRRTVMLCDNEAY